MRDLLRTPARRRCFALLLVLAGAAGIFGQSYRTEDWARRDQWQRPEAVMDALGIGAGARVADIGAGRGYFTLRLARRVGPEGKVFAVDIDSANLRRLRELAQRERLPQVEVVEGRPDDPALPPESVDVVLVVNAYHEMRDYDAMLGGMRRALRPGGLLAVIDEADQAGLDRQRYHSRHRIAAELVHEDAQRNGFRFLRSEPGFTTAGDDEWYFLVFQKSSAGDGDGSGPPRR